MRSARDNNLKAKVVLHNQQGRASTRRAEIQASADEGGQRARQRPRRAGLGDEVRRESRCDNCRTMGHVARDCIRKGEGKGKGGDGGKGYAKGEGNTMKRFRRSQGRTFGRTEKMVYRGECWTCGRIGQKSVECRRRVGGVEEEDVDHRISGEEPESEEDGDAGGVWIVGNVEEIEEDEETSENFFCTSARRVLYNS